METTKRCRWRQGPVDVKCTEPFVERCRRCGCRCLPTMTRKREPELRRRYARTTVGEVMWWLPGNVSVAQVTLFCTGADHAA